MIALAFSSLVLGLDCHAGNVFINLRTEVEVDRADLNLADIAEVISRDPASASKLGATFVARCPSLSRLCHIQKTDISEAIETLAAQQQTRVIWGAAETVAIRGRKRSLPLTSVIDRTAIELVQRLGRGSPMAISISERPTSVEVPPGNTEFHPEFAQMLKEGSTIELPINVLVDGISVARPVVRYTVRRIPHPPRTESQSNAFVSHTENKTVQATVFSPESQAQTSGSERAVEAMAVTKNKKVRLLIGSGPVRIETEGIALADASIGSIVDVRRDNGLAAIKGRAIDYGTVEIEDN